MRRCQSWHRPDGQPNRARQASKERPAKTNTAPKRPARKIRICKASSATTTRAGFRSSGPSEFEGKRLEDVSDSELAELRKERNDAAVERAPNLGVLPGSNPVHWFESFGAKNSRAWLVVDPPDGRVPPLVAEAQGRRARRRQQLRQRAVQHLPGFSLYDRCITRGVPAR